MLKERIKTGKVEPCLINELGFAEKRPIDTSLDPSKIIKATGLRFTKLKDNIKKIRDAL